HRVTIMLGGQSNGPPRPPGARRRLGGAGAPLENLDRRRRRKAKGARRCRRMRQGFALFAGTSADNIRAVAPEAERRGYDSFWVNQPGAPDGLAALGQATRETRRIALGIGVIPLHTRGPESITQGVRDQGLPLDRLLLGVGSPNPGSLRRVREGVAAL